MNATAELSSDMPARRARPRAAVAAVPTLVALGLLLVSAWTNGAFQLRSWGPLGVFALILLAAAPGRRLSGAGLVTVGAIWMFAGWSLLSAVVWSEAPSTGIQDGARNLLYAGLVALPIITLPDRRWRLRAAAALSAGAAALVLAAFVACLLDGPQRFLAGRLNDPIGYRNGTAALFVLAFWLLIPVAARRRNHWLARAGAFSLAVTALGMAFLTQSRGVLLGFAAGAIVAVGLGPDRLRRAWPALFAVGAIALGARWLLAPYHTFVKTSTTSPDAIRRALAALAVIAVLSLVVAFIAAVFDGGLRITDEAERRVSRLATLGLGLLVTGAVALAVATIGNPLSYISDKAREFERLDAAAPTGTRLGSTGGQRYDLWRISWREFRSSPVVGVGVGGYAADYYAQRSTDRNVSTPHSLVMSTLGETGLVGLSLLAAMLIGAAVGIGRRWRRLPADDRRWISALGAAAAVFFGQSAVDWFWLIPGLTGLALSALGIALAAAMASDPDHAPRAASNGPRWTTAWRLAPLAAVAIVGAVYLSDVYVRAARAAPPAAAGARLQAAQRAAALDPFALTPRYLQAGAEEQLGDRAAARATLLDALRRESRNFVTMGLLGDLEMRAGHVAAARRWYRRALALNPRDIGIRQLATRGAAG